MRPPMDQAMARFDRTERERRSFRRAARLVRARLDWLFWFVVGAAIYELVAWR